ncbi:MAG TPA: dihydrofolate reductase [Steroidobacteraceae bacterium]|nr:dihydrofolate reductase [Steroidobacteraceae bacterium]
MELVVAVAENDVIGRGNHLPWRLSADLRRFKALTWGKPILMGRRTYESIGHALPGRQNLVLSRSSELSLPDCIVVPSIAAAYAAALAAPLMVIGGAEVYRLCLPFIARIHLTLVHTPVEGGDAFFEGWRGPQWREASRERHEADDGNSSPYSFVTLERCGSGASPASMSRAARA